MMKLMQDGDWRLCQHNGSYVNGEYVIMHRCERISPWVSRSGSAWSWVVEHGGIDLCIGCKKAPPPEMVGFISMLKWER